MADQLNRLSRTRFFCHRCLSEFRGIPQEYLCPYCHTGFIEQLDDAPVEIEGLNDDIVNAAMSASEGLRSFEEALADEVEMMRPPPGEDVALLLTGGPLRNTAMSPSDSSDTGTTSSDSSTTNSSAGPPPPNPRRTTLMEELVWMIGGNRPPPGAMTAGAPFVLVGTPGDYVFGGEGLDAVVTQLLGQLEHSGPPPLPRDRLAAIPTQPVSEEQAAANIACSVCWENFQLGETTSRLICDHIFHQTCIEPWLQLHATCPICRRSLLQPTDATVTIAAAAATTEQVPVSAPTTGAAANGAPTVTEARIRLAPRVIIRRAAVPHASLLRQFPTQTQVWDPVTGTFMRSTNPTGTITAGLWAPPANNSTPSTNSSTSLNNMEYNTDIDYD